MRDLEEIERDIIREEANVETARELVRQYSIERIATMAAVAGFKLGDRVMAEDRFWKVEIQIDRFGFAGYSRCLTVSGPRIKADGSVGKRYLSSVTKWEKIKDASGVGEGVAEPTQSGNAAPAIGG